MGKDAIFITKTGLLLAVALGIQIGLAPFAQPVVGPLVNMVLLLAVVSVGPVGAIMIGSLTPIIAFAVGVLGFLPLVPIVIAGNSAFALAFWMAGKKNRILGVLTAALSKFFLMAAGVRILAAVFLPNLPPPITAAMSLPQLYTALIGGFLGIFILRYLPEDILVHSMKT